MNPGNAVPHNLSPKNLKRWLLMGIQAELALFRRPLLVLSAFAIVLVPSLYAVFYISSFWDPYSHLDRLPVALVNVDRGATRGGRTVHLGDTVVNTFEHKPPFRFVRLPSAQAANEAVRIGDVYFALVIPADFSERALAARQDQPATLILQVAEGANYTSALISKRFGDELAHTLNEKLNLDRWASIIGDRAAPSKTSVRTAIDQLREGGRKVNEGVQQVQDGITRLDNSLDQAVTGISRLAEGTGRFADTTVALSDGMGRIAAGGRRLEEGAGQLRQGADKVPFAGRRLSEGATQLEKGLQTMLNQLPSAEQRNRVTFAAGQLRDGGSELTIGLTRLRDGSHQLVEGSKKLKIGTSEMVVGLDRLHTGFTSGLGDADAGGLAASVRVNIESTAPVPNNGTAFSPYFAALSLWVGAIMMTFVFHFRRIIDPMKEAPRWVRWLVKAAVPLCLGVLQATVVVAVLRLAFGMSFAHPWLVWLAATLGSLTFVAIILLLLEVLGDAGRLLAVVLLILQLAAAGGIYPIELSGIFYEFIHPYLPFTALVNAFRATMFDAFGGAWSAAAAQLAVTGCGATVLAIWLARWKYVSKEDYGPAVEF